MSNFAVNPKPWSADLSPPEQTSGQASPAEFDASINAISFGFVATAVLISIFLIMAILEHILRPRASSLSPRQAEGQESQQTNSATRLHRKLRNSKHEVASFPAEYTVLMPGYQNPTHLAQPAPLLPCPREGMNWPCHAHHHHHPSLYQS